MQKETARYISVKDAELINRVIESAKERFSIKDLAHYFTSELGWKEREHLIDALMQDKDIKEDIIYRVKDELKVEGYTILKAQTMDKKSMLDEFISSVLCPFYNEHEKTMFV